MWVSPAVTRLVSRQQGGLGQRHGFVSMLAARENVGTDIADQAPPHIPAPELPSRRASELASPTRMLRHARTSCRVCGSMSDFVGPAVCAAQGSSARSWTRGVERSNKTTSRLTQLNAFYSSKVDEIYRVVRVKARLVAKGFG